LPLVRWFAYFFTKIIKSVKGVGLGDVSDVINQTWDATNEAADGTTDAWDRVNQASDEATEAWDTTNEAANASTEAWDGTNDASDAINQAWVMTNEAWDEANQASVIAGKPQKVVKNGFSTRFATSSVQKQTDTTAHQCRTARLFWPSVMVTCGKDLAIGGLGWTKEAKGV
jgi:hypothetical protein